MQESPQCTTTPPRKIEVESINLKYDVIDLCLGERINIFSSVSPDNADKTLQWSTDDDSVAKVDSNGMVLAVGGGQTTVTATAKNGVSSTAKVSVDGSSALLNLAVTHPRQDNNNIGSDWSYNIKVNDENPQRSMKLTAGDTLTFFAEFTEDDNNPDVGRNTAKHTVTDEDLINGFTVNMDLFVTENGGKNSGKTASFKVIFSFSR